MNDLAAKQCVPCKGGVPPIAETERTALLSKLDRWEIVEHSRLHKSYSFKNFIDALSWVNKIGEISEEQGHHPDLELGWGYVRVTVWTHKIDDLTESDFILAAKFDEALSQKL